LLCPSQIAGIFAHMKFLRNRTTATLAIAILLCIATSCHHTAYNPFLHMKTKPSQRQLGKDAEVNKKDKRAYKKQMRKTRRRLYGG